MPRDNTHAPLTPAVLHILLALSTGPRHGYGIMKQVKADADEQVSLGPGTLYGSLRRMIHAGLIHESEKELTPKTTSAASIFTKSPVSDNRRWRQNFNAIVRSSQLRDESAFRQRDCLMPRKCQLLRHRRWYARLLRLYPKPFRERFQESMEQTFYDACRANASIGRGFFGLVLWLYVDTAGGIMNEHIRLLLVRHKSIVRAALVTLGVLLIPLCGTLLCRRLELGLARLCSCRRVRVRCRLGI